MPQEKQRQLVKSPGAIRRICQKIESQREDLEFAILNEPTGYPREELTSANILLMEALSHLKEVS